MIQSNELRIGNYVFHNDSVRPVWQIGNKSVSFLTGQDSKGLNHFQSYNFKGVNPIPLTEEWLFQFGFEKSTFYNNTYSKSIQTLNGSHDIFIDVSANVVLLDTIEVGNFKHVHQLQNLYFAICGEELVRR